MRGIRYNDPHVGIEWPAGLELIPSQRDAQARLLRELVAERPFDDVG